MSLFPRTVPSYYPNRAVRRAVQQNRWSRLPGEWRAFLTLNTPLVSRIKEAL